MEICVRLSAPPPKMALDEAQLAEWMENNQPVLEPGSTLGATATILDNLGEEASGSGLTESVAFGRGEEVGEVESVLREGFLGDQQQVCVEVKPGTATVEEEAGRKSGTSGKATQGATDLFHYRNSHLERQKPPDIDWELWREVKTINRLLDQQLEERCRSELRAREQVAHDRSLEISRKFLKFRCDGCQYRAKTLSQMTEHLAKGRPLSPARGNGEGIQCIRCDFRASNICLMSRHMIQHQRDPFRPNRGTEGFQCKRCARRIRSSRVSVHNLLYHNIPTKVAFQDRYLNEWRQWFHGW